MKQSNNIPRRVGTSLIRSMNYFATQVIAKAKEANTEGGYGSNKATHPSHTNKKLITQKDLDTCENITRFYSEMNAMLSNQEVPSGGFITVAKHKEDRTKYVATPTSFGLVTTTTTLKRIATLASTVVSSEREEGHLKKDRITKRIMVCEEQYGGYNDDTTPHFLRLLDLIRYLDETEVSVIEMSMDGIEHDYRMERAYNDNSSYYSRRGTRADAEMSSKMAPMISDRYQDDSWEHYLTTQYAGLVDVNKYCPTATPMVKAIAVSELNALEV